MLLRHSDRYIGSTIIKEIFCFQLILMVQLHLKINMKNVTNKIDKKL